jgi:hypothetical protein
MNKPKTQRLFRLDGMDIYFIAVTVVYVLWRAVVFLRKIM